MRLIGKNIDDIFIKLSKMIINQGEYVNCRGMKTKELVNCSFSLTDINHPQFLNNKMRNLSIRYAFGELFWYLSQSDSLEHIAYYSSKYKLFSDNAVSLNGAYGPRIMPWIPQIVNLLKEDPYSRRAVINVYKQSDIGKNSKDIPCTIAIQFLVRNNKLDMYVYMRSNDLYLGLPYDVFAFTFLQKLVSRQLNIPLGTYNHQATSIHIYEKDYAFFLNLSDILEAKHIPDLYNIIDNLSEALEIERCIRKNIEYIEISKDFFAGRELIEILKKR